LALTVSPSATVDRARELMVKHQLTVLPVVAGMFVVGSVSRHAVERALAGRASAAPVSVRAAA
jgi:CBS domain-containing protein